MGELKDAFDDRAAALELVIHGAHADWLVEHARRLGDPERDKAAVLALRAPGRRATRRRLSAALRGDRAARTRPRCSRSSRA